MVSRTYSVGREMSEGANTSSVLSIQGLRTYYFTRHGVVKAVDGVNLDLNENEVLGVVGESGCGKTATAFSILNLLEPPGHIVDGRILFDGEDLLKASESEIRRIRGGRISLIFQDPRSFLSPYLSVESQFMDVFVEHLDIILEESNVQIRNRQDTRRFAHDSFVKLLSDMMIPDPERILKSYPHQLSGGMSQRIMIGMAILAKPKVIIADEPTTNLDVTVQAQILELLKNRVREFGSSLIIITHDMGIVAEICDRVAVMYAGQIVEYGTVYDVFRDPKHPYTQALIRASPRLKKDATLLQGIAGSAPDLVNLPSGCYFNPRCPFVFDRCRLEAPKELPLERGWVRCHLYDKK
jgi:peptide/nickel transport system ATP-binding protein